MAEPHALVEVILGGTSLDKAKKRAALAVAAGADRIAIATPLIYSEGYRAISEVKALASTIPVLADLKVHDGCHLFLTEARRRGADIGTVAAYSNYVGCREGVRARSDCGIGIVADLTCIPLSTFGRQAAEIAAVGVDGLALARGHDTARYEESRAEYDGLDQLRSSVSIPLGCTVSSVKTAQIALALGADWVSLDEGVANEDLHDAVQTLRKAPSGKFRSPAASGYSRT